MQHVYLLQHETRAEDVKVIGIYSTEEAALEAIDRLRKQPGFSDEPDGFHVDKYELDKDHWVEGYFSYPTE